MFLVFVILIGTATGKTKKNKIAQLAKQAVDEVLVQSPQDNEVCFSPDERCDLKLKKFIESAKTTLDISVFDINEDQVVHSILVQAQKIPVRVLVDTRQSKGQYSSVGLLKKAGVKVKYGRQRGIMHNKFTLVDGTRIQTGSFNYTRHASIANQENQVYLSTPSIVERYKLRFEKMWSEGREEIRSKEQRSVSGVTK